MRERHSAQAPTRWCRGRARLRDRTGQTITVVSRCESAPFGPRGDYWQITVNDDIPAGDDDPALGGVHAYPPSLPYLAFLVQLHLHRNCTL